MFLGFGLRCQTALPPENSGRAGLTVFRIREIPQLCAHKLCAPAQREAPGRDAEAGRGDQSRDGVNIRLTGRPERDTAYSVNHTLQLFCGKSGKSLYRDITKHDYAGGTNCDPHPRYSTIVLAR